jgi:hypothetical protein
MPTKTILIMGDFILDYHIYEGRRHHYGQSRQDGVKVKPQLGGAALVYQILRALLKPGWRPFLSVKDPVDDGLINRFDPSEHAYAFWRPHPKRTVPEYQFWRVSEAMGFGAADQGRTCGKWELAEDSPAQPEIVIVSEGGMGFRECRDDWQLDKLKTAQWIVLKTTSSLGTGALWQHLADHYRDKLIVVVAAHELRKSPARLNLGLSWEATIEDLIRELGLKGSLNALTHCRHLVVDFESEGALWLDYGVSRTNGQPSPMSSHAHFVFDGGLIEGEHAYEIEGAGFGFLSCLAAAVAWELTLNPERPNFAAALEGGLSAMRDLRERGHGPAPEAPTGFPSERLATVIKHPKHCYSRAIFPLSRERESEQKKTGDSTFGTAWTLLRQAQRHHRPAYEFARLVLLRGTIALQNLPHLRVGNLITVDRSEVEALRTLTQVIRRYKQYDASKKPLSVGVFGPPGAGKSFAVREIATNLLSKDSWMEFNLSQFNTPDDLIGAFHQIRDQVLLGRLPVAFFDEFDSHDYHWLQYLLAPMQDGKFQEGQLTHALGKCIFVFAGGTSWSFETFGPPRLGAGSVEDAAPYRKFCLAKGPDFHSRLDAYLNVVGPNQRQVSPPPDSIVSGGVVTAGGHTFGLDPDDLYFPIRRALIIRSELKCGRDDKLEIDEGLLHALLHVERYTHGSRSLGKILQPLRAAGSGRLHRSLLMPLNQLAMHTNAGEFIRLCSDAPQPISLDSPLTQKQIRDSSRYP